MLQQLGDLGAPAQVQPGHRHLGHAASVRARRPRHRSAGDHHRWSSRHALPARARELHCCLKVFKNLPRFLFCRCRYYTDSVMSTNRRPIVE